jgi:hypothetical protein
LRVTAPAYEDPDGAPPLLASIRYLSSWLRHVFADGACAGDKLDTALAGAGNGGWRSSSDPTQAKGS